MAKIKLGKVLDTHKGYNIRQMLIGGNPTNQVGIYKGKNYLVSGKVGDLRAMKSIIDKEVADTEKQRATDKIEAAKESKRLADKFRRTW